MTSISVIQILKQDLEYRKVISENAKFLSTVKVEYIIYDTLKGYEVLEFIKGIGNIKYVRKNFISNKSSFLESGLLASGEKLIFLKSGDSLNTENVEKIEKARPNILKRDLKKITNIKNENFKYDDFNLLVKDNKTFFERLRLMLKF